MNEALYYSDDWDTDKECLYAFRDFISNLKGWSIVYGRSYRGTTSDRYKIFKAGYRIGSTPK